MNKEVGQPGRNELLLGLKETIQAGQQPVKHARGGTLLSGTNIAVFLRRLRCTRVFPSDPRTEDCRGNLVNLRHPGIRKMARR